MSYVTLRFSEWHYEWCTEVSLLEMGMDTASVALSCIHKMNARSAGFALVFTSSHTELDPVVAPGYLAQNSAARCRFQRHGTSGVAESFLANRAAGRGGGAHGGTGHRCCSEADSVVAQSRTRDGNHPTTNHHGMRKICLSRSRHVSQCSNKR